MKLTVLVDNNTLIDRYFWGEPGVSYLIETDGKQILFDVGYSDAFIQNAHKMNLDLLRTDYIVLSHGHLDHTWGLDPLLKLYTEAKIEVLPAVHPTLTAHPDVFEPKTEANVGQIGCTIPRSQMASVCQIDLHREPFWLTDQLVFLGEIQRNNDFENQSPIGETVVDEQTKPDFLLDDSALAYKGKDGLIIITGCSHSGICNIIGAAKQICHQDEIADVIGGFHLMQPTTRQLAGTLDHFRELQAATLHACHCVDLDSKIALAQIANLAEVGVGLTLAYD